jgi:hypothetical protein
VPELWKRPKNVKVFEMASSPFSNQRARAARWMHERKDRPVGWWRWTVLTTKNSDPECLKLDERTAFLVFSDFVHDGMLVPIIAAVCHDILTLSVRVLDTPACPNDDARRGHELSTESRHANSNSRSTLLRPPTEGTRPIDGKHQCGS